MAETFSIDPNEIVRVVDPGTRAEIETAGRIDKDKQDHLKITGNGTNRVINIKANNDTSGVADVMCHITGKGDGGLNAGSDTDMFRTCPWLRAVSDPAFAVTFFDDFMAFDDTDDWIATTATTGTTACVAGFGGIIEMDSGAITQGQGEQIQLTTPSFLPAAGNTLWFEARLKVTDTITKVQMFAGLSDIDTEIITSNDVGASDYIGWLLDDSQQTADESTPYLSLNSAAGSEEFGTANTTAMVEDTYIRLGFILDGITTLTPYLNGTAGTAITVSSIPLIPLTPSFVCQTNGTNDPIMSVDWVKVCQLR